MELGRPTRRIRSWDGKVTVNATPAMQAVHLSAPLALIVSNDFTLPHLQILRCRGKFEAIGGLQRNWPAI